MTVLEIPTPDPRTFDDTSRSFAEAVASRYAIKRLIGRGGMGIVYLARDRRLDRLVAIKTLPPQLARDESVRQRFLRETRTAGAMSHPNIVPIHGADEVDGHVYFVMGFVDGESLAAHVRGMGRLTPATVLPILRDVTAALAHAHGRGTIHRDVKAENILVERVTGRALVTDFGIARLAEAAPLTATGQMLGTVYYISPEQVAGERVDARSDLYSLGVVGFFALTGCFPFESELASAVLVAHVNKPAPPVRSLNPDVPPSLAAIVDRCLAKNPARRYASADGLLEALNAITVDEKAPSRPMLISDTEAQAVWGRAAALQASTAAQSRPSLAGEPRDVAKDRARTSGHKVADVVDAGREAGINTRFLDRALVERGLARAPTGATVPLKRSLWAGVPLDIVETAEVDGEIGVRHFDRLINILRDGTRYVGTTTAATREVGWHAAWTGHRLDASVVPADGVTSIRLAQSVRRMAAGVMMTALAAGTSIGAISAGLSNHWMRLTPTPQFIRTLGISLFMSRGSIKLVAAGIGIAIALSSIPIARAIIRAVWRSNASRLRLLAEALVANARLDARE